MTTKTPDAELPREVSRGKMMIGEVEIEVVHLSNGQRVVTAESVERFFTALNRPTERN